jgi:hypothetical protein
MVMRSTLEAEIERLTTLLSEEKKRNAEREGEFCKINAELHKEIQRRGVYAEGLEKVLLGLSMYVGAGPDPSGVMYRDIVQTYSAKAREALKAKPTASIPTGASREGVVTVREQPPKPQSVAARVGEEVRKEMAEAKAAMGEPHAARRLLGEETHEIDNEVPPGVIEAICKWMEWPLPAMEQDARDFWRCIAAAFAEGGKVSSPQRYNSFDWRPMSEKPTATGKYLVAHRGVVNVRHYLHPEGEWVSGSVVGWQGDLSWGPTHWSAIPDLPDESLRTYTHSEADRG